MQTKLVPLWRVAIAAALVGGTVIAACAGRTKQPEPYQGIPLGQSTAQGPSDPNVAPPDAAGVPRAEAPTPDVNPPSVMNDQQVPPDGGEVPDATIPQSTVVVF